MPELAQLIDGSKKRHRLNHDRQAAEPSEPGSDAVESRIGTKPKLMLDRSTNVRSEDLAKASASSLSSAM